jgi:secreted trypsin-like serine protease
MSSMRRTLIVVSCTMGLAVLASGTAGAIVYGEFDGEQHPNVGAIVADWRDPGSGNLDLFCSGTLIAPDVFLTAAHCTASLAAQGIEPDEVFVTFDPVFDENATLLPGVYDLNPAFGQGGANDTHDVAVIILNDPAAGITPAELPPAGLLSDLNASGELRDTRFTAVGYGTVRETNRRAFDAILDNTERRFADQQFRSLTEAWMTLSMNVSTGDGGTCYGDSGGPHFLGAGENETDVVASITVTGDAVCKATDKTYRMDTDSARDYLETFVDLP